MKSQLETGELDGIVFVTGLPTPALTELIAAQPLDFIQPSADQIAIIIKDIPEMSPSVVPAGTTVVIVTRYSMAGASWAQLRCRRSRPHIRASRLPARRGPGEYPGQCLVRSPRLQTGSGWWRTRDRPGHTPGAPGQVRHEAA